MAFVAVAIGGSALAGLAGAAISSSASGDAADKQAAAADRASAVQKQMYEEQRNDQQPWREAGAHALSQMGDPSFNQTFNPKDMESVDPGYAFRMQQGQQALERSAAARGGLNNGGTLKALSQYGQDYASNEYQNAYSRFKTDQNDRFNRLATVAGVGQVANGQTAAAGQNYANQVGNNMTGAGNAQGGAAIARGNAWSGALSGLGQVGGNWMGYQQLQKTNNWMDRMLPSGGGTQTLPATNASFFTA